MCGDLSSSILAGVVFPSAPVSALPASLSVFDGKVLEVASIVELHPGVDGNMTGYC